MANILLLRSRTQQELNSQNGAKQLLFAITSTRTRTRRFGNSHTRTSAHTHTAHPYTNTHATLLATVMCRRQEPLVLASFLRSFELARPTRQNFQHELNFQRELCVRNCSFRNEWKDGNVGDWNIQT